MASLWRADLSRTSMPLPIRILALVAALLLSAATASAHSVKAGALELTDLWTRATPPSAPTAGGYLTITNTGAEPDRLTAVASPQAAKGELHEMSVKDGIMTMRPVEGGIEIPAGQSVTLAPSGLHIMFVSPKEPFVEGEKVPVVLTFEKAGKVETFLHVEGIGAPGPNGAKAGEHDHSQGATP
jgi:copper(I)-binding protein